MTKWLKNSISFRYFLPWLMVTLADVFAVLLSYAFHFSLGWAICFSSMTSCIFLYFFLKNDIRKEPSIPLENSFKTVLLYLPVLFLANGLTGMLVDAIQQGLLNAGMLQASDLQTTNQAVIDMLYSENMIPVAISCLLAGYSEELVYRYSTYHMFHHPKAAFFLSWFFFGYAHVSFSSLASVISGITYFTMSFILTYVYHRHRDIRANILLHTSMNAIALLLMA